MTTIIEEKFNTFLASGDPIIGISDEQRDWILPLIENLRKDWLRSEIEKVEGKRIPEFVAVSEADALNIEGFNQALTSIISRYKEELLELEKGIL